MMTVITKVTLKEGAEPEWDAAIRRRLEAATGRPGWIRGQLVIPLEALNQRMVIGTWESRAAWEAWHEDDAFKESRERLVGLEEAPSDMSWYEVIADVHQ